MTTATQIAETAVMAQRNLQTVARMERAILTGARNWLEPSRAGVARMRDTSHGVLEICAQRFAALTPANGPVFNDHPQQA